MKKRLSFDQFEVLVPKGHEKIVDKDATTDYLFINAPKGAYSVYFDSAMPVYEASVLDKIEEHSSMRLKLKDRTISFFCPSAAEDKKLGVWYFNVEFTSPDGQSLFLPGQILIKFDQLCKQALGLKLPFVEVLKGIRLNLCGKGQETPAWV